MWRKLGWMALVAMTACTPKPASDAGAEPASSVAGLTSGDVLDCLSPVTGTTTGRQAADTFGAALTDGDVGGPEGMQVMGAMLYKDDPARRIDIVWWDDARTAVSMVRVRGDSRVTGPLGIRVGSTLAEVEAINGKPFTISGFGWDYGGFAVDYKGGTLNSLSGGCHVSLRFDNVSGTAPMPDGISGDGVQVSSDDSRVKTYAPVVTEISVGWPLPPGVTPAQ